MFNSETVAFILANSQQEANMCLIASFTVCVSPYVMTQELLTEFS